MTGWAENEGVHGLVRRQVLARPDACAVRDHTGRELSYRELWQQSGQLAAELVALGVGRGDAVAVTLDRSVELVVALLGIARSGGYYALLDPNAPNARNNLILDETAARVVLSETLLPTQESTMDCPVGPDDTLYVSFTSGSTGRPKGVVAPHGAVANFVLETRLCAYTPGDRVASLSSTASDATTMEIWKTLVAGATVVVLPQVTDLELEDWLAVVRRERVTVMFLMTALFQLIAQADPGAFASLDTVMFGGEAANIDTVRAVCRTAPPRRLVQGYGPTEATVFATFFDCTTESLAGRARIPLGEPLENYTVHLLDEHLREVGPDAVGELCVGGPGVASGYLARPELTASRFVHFGQSSIYRTGDLVRRLPNGSLEFLGRADRQVKVRGYRVELEDVERSIESTGLVRSAVVELVRGERGEHLVCFFVPAASSPDLAVRLPTALSERLPGYMIPPRWVEVPAVPVTSTGKVDRARLLSHLAA